MRARRWRVAWSPAVNVFGAAGREAHRAAIRTRAARKRAGEQERCPAGETAPEPPVLLPAARRMRSCSRRAKMGRLFRLCGR